MHVHFPDIRYESLSGSGRVNAFYHSNFLLQIKMKFIRNLYIQVKTLRVYYGINAILRTFRDFTQ